MGLVISFILLLLQPQLMVTVIDARSLNPVPYTIVLSSQFNGITNEQGELSLPDNIDSLIFRCLGYEQYTIAFAELEFERGRAIIKLKAKTFELNAVEVTAKRITKIPLGYFTKRSRASHGSSGGGQMALFIPPDKRGNLIGLPVGSVSFYIRKWSSLRKFRVRLYSVNPESGEPGEDLLPEAVYAQPQKGDEWVSVRLRQYGITYPENGVFAGIEFLPNTEEHNDADGKMKTLNFGVNFEDVNNGRTWSFIFKTQKWEQCLPLHKDQRVGNAMIKLELFKEKK
ncbi:MAG TPA: hypothetical protein DG754_14835 [Bacteroidales bacterium]|jgi:hypothetical protein|nr:hypothetical protein [Bacteroidales bacterium]